MGLFKKKEQKKIYLPSSHSEDKEIEAAKLKALEASLEFLSNPRTVEQALEQEAQEKQEASQNSAEEQNKATDQNGQQKTVHPETPVNPTSGPASAAGIKTNPVAPAIQPSDRILHPGAANAPAAGAEKNEDKKTDSMPPVPKVPEVKPAESAAENGPKVFGRRMDYRTAVVNKTAPQAGPATTPVKPIAPTAVSNVPPAPHMPQNISSKAPIPPTISSRTQMPAKTIVPTVPSVPEKAKPTVMANRAPMPEDLARATTLVAASGENSEVPPIPAAPEPTIVQKAVEMPRPAEMNKPEPVAMQQKRFAEEQKAAQNAQTPVTGNPSGAEGKNETGKEKKPEMIKNPLPTPKKHVAKEMDFDHQPISTQMHFDLVDMTGMDFFDIN